MAKLKKEIVLLTLLSAIGGFLFGYDTGVISGAMLLIEEDPDIAPNTVWKELIVSATVGAAWIFSLIAGPFSEQFGRKPTILLASVVFTIGSVVMGVATNKEILLVGRIIVGVGIGFASMSVPIYISEAAPPSVRGLLVSTNVLVITFGQFIATIVCGAFSYHPEGWKFMLGLAGVPSLLQLVGFYFMPESPRWLVSKGRVEEARKILEKIRLPEENVDEEVKEIAQTVETESAAMVADGGGTGTWAVLKKIVSVKSARRAVILGCLLQLFQQVAGINTVMYYSAKIINMAGFSDNSQAIWISSGVASINFLCTFIGLLFVERIGRRKLLLISLAGVVVALGFLGGGFWLSDSRSPDITIHEAGNAECASMMTCGECTTSHSCGFCYVEYPNGTEAEGSCVAISQDGHEEPLYGRCAADNHDPTLRFAPDYCPSDVAWIVVLGLCLYLFFFAPGMGPMPWTINSEIYPLWARSIGQSLATSVNWAANLVISMTFLSLTEAITKQGAFLLYMGVAFLGFLIFLWILPETKGKTLEEVEELFKKPYPSPFACGKGDKAVDKYEAME